MNPDLEDVEIDVKIKLGGLWTSVMFLYIYADYFGLFIPGALKTMLLGKMDPFGAVTQPILLGTSLMMAIPSVMIFLSLALRAPLNRWLNMIFGVLYAIIILITMWGWAFSIFYGIIEVGLTSLVAWYAWRWPRPTRGAANISNEAECP